MRGVRALALAVYTVQSVAAPPSDGVIGPAPGLGCGVGTLPGSLRQPPGSDFSRPLGRVAPKVCAACAQRALRERDDREGPVSAVFGLQRAHARTLGGARGLENSGSVPARGWARVARAVLSSWTSLPGRRPCGVCAQVAQGSVCGHPGIAQARSLACDQPDRYVSVT